MTCSHQYVVWFSRQMLNLDWPKLRQWGQQFQKTLIHEVDPIRGNDATINYPQCIVQLQGKLSWTVLSWAWKRQPELFKFDSRGHRCKAKPPAYDGSLAAKEITTDKIADSVNEKWPENLACCHKWLYLNACAAHDSFPLI